MSRRQMLLTIATISAMAAMLACYGMAWLARDLKSFTDHWASFPNTMVVFALLAAAAVFGIAAAEGEK